MDLTQELLAKFLSTSREQIAYYENGTRTINSLHLNKLANLFCMNEFDFFEETLQKSQINIAFAFRADKLETNDLASIARFKKIVLNYINMKNALNEIEK